MTLPQRPRHPLHRHALTAALALSPATAANGAATLEALPPVDSSPTVPASPNADATSLPHAMTAVTGAAIVLATFMFTPRAPGTGGGHPGAKVVDRPLRPVGRRSDLDRHLVRHAFSGVLFFDRDGRVYLRNRAARSLFRPTARLNAPAERPRGADLFDADDRRRVADACARALGRTVDAEVGLFAALAAAGVEGGSTRWRCRSLDGQTFEADVRFLPLASERMPVAAIVRPLPASDRGLRMAEAESSTGVDRSAVPTAGGLHPLAVTGHELRTPINAMISLAELMRERYDCQINAELERDLRQLARVAGEMRSIVDSLLDAQRPHSSMPTTPLDANAVIRETCEALRALAAQRRSTIIVEADEPVAPLHVDPTLLARVLRNLIGNAVSHAAGSTIRVAVSPAGADAVAIRVADDGPGITRERLAELNAADVTPDPAAERPLGSSGLGIAICRQALATVGGRLEVRSETGLGTTCTVTIPRSRRSHECN